MICYRDMTFCPFWRKCKDSLVCGRAETPEIKKKAEEVRLPICHFAEKPECFREIE